MTVDRSPLVEFAPRLHDASARSAGAVRIAEEPLWQQVNLRIDPSFASSLATVLGGELPMLANTVTAVGPAHLVWLGPDEWLWLAPQATDGLETDLRAAAAAPVSVVDVSASRTVISVAGPAARDVLAHGCSLDLDPARFTPGSCAQTRLALANVVLIASSEQTAEFVTEPRFLILVRASFARYLAAWLLDAATEYLSG